MAGGREVRGKGGAREGVSGGSEGTGREGDREERFIDHGCMIIGNPSEAG